jgi:hypothetical protein
MAAVDLGAAVTVTWPGTQTGTVAAAVTQPDGTAFGGTVTVSGSQASFTPTMAGRHLVRFSATGGAYQDVVDVWPTDVRAIISLQDGKDALGWPATGYKAADETDLRLYIAAATPVIEDIVGAVVYGQHVFKGDGGKPGVVLPGAVQSIVSVTENGYPVPSGYYVWDETSNTLTAGTNWAPRRFMPSVRGVVVTYMGGYQVIPANIILATRELVRHLWQIGKQGTRPNNGNLPVTGDAFTPSGYAVPRRVIELCAASTRTAGGFA